MSLADVMREELLIAMMGVAADKCSLAARTTEALLWRDAMHYLRQQQHEIETLRFALLCQECREALKVAEARG